ncbi:MAG: hypothetical protein ACK4NY_01525 [Spirosomataceae bacterium]
MIKVINGLVYPNSSGFSNIFPITIHFKISPFITIRHLSKEHTAFLIYIRAVNILA